MSVTGPFLEYLIAALDLKEDEIPKTGAWSSISNTLGALALRLNLLTPEQVDQILEVQEEGNKGKRFGEVGINLGLLTAEHVEILLELQKADKRLELGQQLVLTGKLDVPGLFRCLADFASAERAGTLT